MARGTWFFTAQVKDGSGSTASQLLSIDAIQG
jgi:hypothetical protein